ncbi:hypothetical protein EVAR_55166_1 [Eumeta japonica]|uniref:Uncharacterized protein n=1 Tax=Eumeta variegata TaxID=151549 RepID=A0A4C1Y9T1_EUMVA|nr:hypothetical protein EVAR_55166_1 [Eumeta japonica]
MSHPLNAADTGPGKTSATETSRHRVCSNFIATLHRQFLRRRKFQRSDALLLSSCVLKSGNTILRQVLDEWFNLTSLKNSFTNSPVLRMNPIPSVVNTGIKIEGETVMEIERETGFNDVISWYKKMKEFILRSRERCNRQKLVYISMLVIGTNTVPSGPKPMPSITEPPSFGTSVTTLKFQPKS